MSAIFGYFHRKGRQASQHVTDNMQRALSSWNPDRAGTVKEQNIVLGNLLLHTTEESLNEALPLTENEAQLILTADARIDNRDDLSKILRLENTVAVPDSVYILRAYQKWESDCCRYLLGDYAFAVWDGRKKELFCARDHIGARGLFYYCDEDKFIFATEPKGIIASGEVPEKLSEDWIANILVGVYPAKDFAPFEKVKKLPPAHCLTVTPEKMTLRQYWDLDTKREIRYKREQDYYEELRCLLTQAIGATTRSAFPVGAELSGGLDSSGIAAIAHAELKKRNEKISVFSHALPGWAEGKIYPFDDEKQFIESVCSFSGIVDQHYITAEDKGIIDEFRLSGERFGYPTGYQLPVFCDALYEKARDEGMRVLLSGFPGDELVTSHGAEFYNELLHRGRYLPLWCEIYRHTGEKYFRTWYRLGVKILAYHTPGLFRLLRGNPEPEVNWRDNSFNCHVVTDEYAEKMHLRERLFDTTSYPVFNNVRERERVRITETFVCHRLEQSAAHALHYHLEYRNPLADRRLLEYVLALPPEIKVKNTFRRYPYRKAVEGIVPPDIQWRTSKMGTTVPTVSLRILRDSERLDELLRPSGNMKFPDYIDMDKMRYIKQRLDNKQLKDSVYPHSFYSALMLYHF
jgi:asparagine synthase (glutamine-hydrolysing)